MSKVALGLAPALAFGIATAAQAFTLSSPAVKPDGTIPMRQVYTQCGGGNVSPELQWRDIPAGTKSFAVSVFDPDAPGGGFWHWIAFNIGAGAYGMNPGAGTPHSGNAPGDTVQMKNGFGNVGYSGPCPPPGKPHHYVFTAYALDVPVLPVSAAAGADRVIATIRQHALATATLTATYGR
ncbi:MAG TPA: YbhB/YbcL family Raf kinase inhibitor-like protein [Rhodanobacteraceae bacterium]|jgi:Raf kinase inhibitor-like YbhB/YbcL family protein|nr:YbhB/YbcL family Raf kinase inhibitor-like protein [Rhodanobacteraceae bacterium]